MTWQDPGGNRAPGDPGLDETRADWPVADPAAEQHPAAAHDPLQPPPGAVGATGAGANPPRPPSAPGQAADPGPVAPPPAGPLPGFGAAPGYQPGYQPGSQPGYAPGGYQPGYQQGYAPGGGPAMSWAPPTQGYGSGVPGAPGLAFAGVPARLVAWLVDIVILAIVNGIITIPLNIILLGSFSWSELVTQGSNTPGMYSTFTFGTLWVVALVASLISIAIDVAYFVLQWSSGARATLGMRLLHLQIGGAADGRTLTRGAGFRRWVAMGSWLGILSAIPVVGGLSSLVSLLWYIVLLATTASSPTRQGLHDRFAESAIVQPTGTSNTGLIVGCLILVAVVAIIPLIAIVALIFMSSQVSTILSTVGDSI